MAQDPPAAGTRTSNRSEDPRWRPTPIKIVAAIVLLAAIVIPLLVGTYATAAPSLFGFPFFYWYQLGWVFLAALACAISFALLRHEDRRLGRNDHERQEERR